MTQVSGYQSPIRVVAILSLSARRLHENVGRGRRTSRNQLRSAGKRKGVKRLAKAVPSSPGNLHQGLTVVQLKHPGAEVENYISRLAVEVFWYRIFTTIHLLHV